MSLDATSSAAGPLYARFSRRFRGILIDWIITLVVMFGALFVAIAVSSDHFSRALGLAVIVVMLFYEPVLVSFTGGTLWHYFANLRVVDDTTGGNVSFLKACARLAIKSLLGWYSFVILAATRRNQAVHDLVTRSTVQIRDPAKARPGQYMTERAESAAGGPALPPRWRRALVILVYLLLLFGAFLAALYVTTVTGMVSAGCVNNDYCSGAERIVVLVADISLLVMMAVIIAQGWRGKLFGARA